MPSDDPAVAVKRRHGWLIPLVLGVEYEHEGEVTDYSGVVA